MKSDGYANLVPRQPIKRTNCLCPRISLNHRQPTSSLTFPYPILSKLQWTTSTRCSVPQVLPVRVHVAFQFHRKLTSRDSLLGTDAPPPPPPPAPAPPAAVPEELESTNLQSNIRTDLNSGRLQAASNATPEPTHVGDGQHQAPAAAVPPTDSKSHRQSVSHSVIDTSKSNDSILSLVAVSTVKISRQL